MIKIRLSVSKFKEWQTAIKLERSYTKEEIITTSAMNLAEVYYALLLDQNKEVAKKIINSLNDPISSRSTGAPFGRPLARGETFLPGCCPAPPGRAGPHSGLTRARPLPRGG